MINLFVEFGFQPLNMEALLDFELMERSSIINNFEARNITIIVTIFRKTTRINEHLFRDKNSHIFKHLSFSKNCLVKILMLHSLWLKMMLETSKHVPKIQKCGCIF